MADGDPLFSGSTHSPFAGVSATMINRRSLENNWSVDTSLFLDARYNFGEQDTPDPFTNDDQTEYNTLTFSPAITARRSTSFAGSPGSAGFGYGLHFETAEIDSIGQLGHTVFVFNEREYSDEMTAGVRAAVNYRDFEVTFPGDAASNRDGIHTSMKAYGEYLMAGRSRSFNGFIQLADNNAKGANFDYTSVSMGANYVHQIEGPLWMTLGVSGDWRDYNSASLAPARTRQNITDLTAQLVWAVGRDWTADATVHHKIYSANVADYEGDRTTFVIGLQRRF